MLEATSQFSPTTPNIAQLSSTQQLIAELSKIPKEWALTPVFCDKKPYRKNWQSEKPISRDLIARDIKSGKAKGFGLRTGTVSGGIVAIDADGYAAHDKITELSGGVPLPDTVAFTSNRPGRCQYLLYVPKKYWGAIATKKIKTGVKNDDGTEQLLELRWDGCQSVLPPSVHPETGFYRWRKSPEEVAMSASHTAVGIAQAPMWVVEQMFTKQKIKHPDQIQLPVDAVVPLTVCLTHRSRDMLRTGSAAPDKGRNDSGIELARDLIGTANYLDELKQSYDGNPEKLFLDWCRACGLDSDKPAEQPKAIWDSANKNSCAPGSEKDGVKTCIRGWHWRENVKATGRGYGSGSGGSGSSGGGDGGDGDGSNSTSKVVRFPSFDALTVEQVTGKIDELIAQGASGSYLTGQLNRLSAASQIYIQELRTLYSQRLAECDLESDRDDNKSQVENLLNLGDRSLQLQDFLPEELANPLNVWCNWLSIRPEVVFSALLGGASSLHKVGTKLVIHRNQSFEVPSSLSVAIVSESGQKKSPVLWNIIRNPLDVLRQEKLDAYNAAMKDYNAQMQAWEKSENKGQKPKPPKDPTLYYFTNATGEAIPMQASKAPEKALLALIDELSGLFNSANSYRGGKGSDKQDMLSYFDGSGQTVLRASGVKVDVRKIYLSIFGTIQPEVLKTHIADCSDPDGQWARFLFVNQPLESATLSDDDGEFVQIRDRITEFYRRIDRLPEMEYHLSRAAFKRYQPVYNQLEKLRVTHPRAGMRAVYSKMEGYIGRLALNLHVLWEVASGKACPDEEIPLFIMEMAIELAKFYIGQVKLVHSFSDEEGLAPGIVKLIELSKRLDANGKDGWVKAQQYRDLFAAKKRPSAEQARSLMLEAQSMGVGRTRGIGNRLEYHWLGDNNNNGDNPSSPTDNLGNSGELREDLGKILPVVESIGIKGVEDNLGNLGLGIPKSTKNKKHGCTLDQSHEKTYEEGGSPPEPSLSCPEESCKAETVGDTELGNNLGKGFPNSPLSSLNEEKPTQEAMVAPARSVEGIATESDEVQDAQALPHTEEAIAPAPSEPDFDKFPHPERDAKKGRAEAIASLILAIRTAEEFFALQDAPQYSKEELNWVRQNLLTKQQRDRIKSILVAAKLRLQAAQSTSAGGSQGSKHSSPLK